MVLTLLLPAMLNQTKRVWISAFFNRKHRFYRALQYINGNTCLPGIPMEVLVVYVVYDSGLYP
jgi:hypothetical protein